MESLPCHGSTRLPLSSSRPLIRSVPLSGGAQRLLLLLLLSLEPSLLTKRCHQARQQPAECSGHLMQVCCAPSLSQYGHQDYTLCDSLYLITNFSVYHYLIARRTYSIALLIKDTLVTATELTSD